MAWLCYKALSQWEDEKWTQIYALGKCFNPGQHGDFRMSLGSVISKSWWVDSKFIETHWELWVLSNIKINEKLYYSPLYTIVPVHFFGIWKCTIKSMKLHYKKMCLGQCLDGRAYQGQHLSFTSVWQTISDCYLSYANVKWLIRSKRVFRFVVPLEKLLKHTSIFWGACISTRPPQTK